MKFVTVLLIFLSVSCQWNTKKQTKNKIYIEENDTVFQFSQTYKNDRDTLVIEDDELMNIFWNENERFYNDLQQNEIILSIDTITFESGIKGVDTAYYYTIEKGKFGFVRKEEENIFLIISMHLTYDISWVDFPVRIGENKSSIIKKTGRDIGNVNVVRIEGWDSWMILTFLNDILVCIEQYTFPN